MAAGAAIAEPALTATIATPAQTGAANVAFVIIRTDICEPLETAS